MCYISLFLGDFPRYIGLSDRLRPILVHDLEKFPCTRRILTRQGEMTLYIREILLFQGNSPYIEGILPRIPVSIVNSPTIRESFPMYRGITHYKGEFSLHTGKLPLCIGNLPLYKVNLPSKRVISPVFRGKYP